MPAAPIAAANLGTFEVGQLNLESSRSCCNSSILLGVVLSIELLQGSRRNSLRPTPVSRYGEPGRGCLLHGMVWPLPLLVLKLNTLRLPSPS